MADGQPLLDVAGLRKSYAVPVLVDIDLTVAHGEIHALVGANGAGKSTFARILSGLTRRDAGLITLDGRDFAPASRAEAEAAGVQMVMQELNLIPTLSVAENLFFNRIPRRLGFVDYNRLHALAEEALEAVGLDGVDPTTPVGRLGVGRQQLVEIAAALARPYRFLILDEPTAALTDPEIDLLFGHMRRLKQEGVGMLYISHRMEEIRRVADRVTVLRDGRVVLSRPAGSMSVDEIVEHMVGRGAVEQIDLGTRSFGPPALEVESLCRGHLVRGVTFEVRRGEILGLAGLVGSGRTETLRAIFGADRAESGRIVREGRDVDIRHPRDAVRHGIGMIPEDRKHQGLLLSQSVELNTSIAHLGAVTEPRGWIDPRREEEVVRRLGEQLDVQAESIDQRVAELSGGNQQKVILARWLLRECDVLLFDEPTRGIDVGAKQLIYRLLANLTSQGKAVVFVSSELRELMTLCDRIAVLSDGRLVTCLERGEWTEERIMSAAFSEYSKRSRTHG